MNTRIRKDMIVFEHYSSTSFPVFVLLIDLPNEVVEAAATTVAAVVADIPPLPPPVHHYD